MSNVPSASPEQTPSVHMVTMEGSYGTMMWTPPQTLYSMMPRAKRDPLLEYAGAKQIAPYVSGLVDRILIHIDFHPDQATLDTTFSLESKEFECGCIGKLVWMFGQGIWDAIPSDQRDVVFRMAQEDMHSFLRDNIIMSLARYSLQSFRPR